MTGVRPSNSFVVRRLTPFLVSKATLDIICLTAFGYDVDSLHNPKSELAEAYHELLDLQNGMFVTQHLDP